MLRWIQIQAHQSGSSRSDRKTDSSSEWESSMCPNAALHPENWEEGQRAVSRCELLRQLRLLTSEPSCEHQTFCVAFNSNCPEDDISWFKRKQLVTHWLNWQKSWFLTEHWCFQLFHNSPWHLPLIASGDSYLQTSEMCWACPPKGMGWTPRSSSLPKAVMSCFHWVM